MVAVLAFEFSLVEAEMNQSQTVALCTVCLFKSDLLIDPKYRSLTKKISI